MKNFSQILKGKREYYGNTEAAIEFAAEEYSRQNEKELLTELKIEGEIYKETESMLYFLISTKLS